MGQKWIFKTGLLLLLVASLHVCSSEETVGNKDVKPADSIRPFDGPFRPLMRRRIVRKRINDDGESNANVTNVSVSMSVSSSRVQRESDGHVITDELLPSPEGLQGDGPTRRPFGKFRPTFINRTRNFADFKPTMEPRETPSVSFREFRLTMKPRLGLNRQKPVTSTSTTEADATEEDTTKPTSTMKPYPVKKLLKGKPRRRTTTTTEEPVAEEENELDDQDDHTAEDDENNTVEVELNPGTDESSSPSTAQESTTEASIKTTVLTTTTSAPIETIEAATIPDETTPRPPRNSSMIIIPVPPSQRKPYHPVIMQVTKTPTTAESLPETRVVTYKLNKMFVPMGIYGKVLPKSASQSDLDVTTENTIVSTPLPFLLPGQESQSKRIKSNVEKDVPNGVYLRTPTPEIKVKGHRSKELEEPMTSGDSSNDFASAVAYASSQKDHHERQQKQWESMMEKLKQKQRNLADDVSLTYQTQRRPNIKDINLTTEKVDPAKISFTTEQSINFDGTRNNQHKQAPWSSFHQMSAPRPFQPNQHKPSKTILGTLTSAASSIPGLLHESLTHLTSGYGTAFEDEARFPGPTEAPPAFVASESQSQAQIVTPGHDDSLESLEFFRKRPHLLQKYKNRGSKNNFLPPEYSSGFKPVTVPPYFASQYFASTPQHSTASPFIASTLASAVKKLREPLYQGTKHWQPPEASSTRDAKQFSSINDLAAWRASVLSGHSQQPKGFSFSSTTPRASFFSSSTPKSFVDQWLEFNQKYSKNEIEDAKDKIYTMFSESRADPYDDLMYMKPPNAPAKGSGSAFDDLLKMFKMGFSIGAGHSTNKKPMLSYSAGMHASDDSFQAASGDGWRPLTKSKSGGGPGVGMISFNAGVTIGGNPTSTPGYTNLFGGGTHYSSSSKPYVPKSTYKELPKSFAFKDLSSKYQTKVPIASRPPPTPGPEYASNIYYNNFKALDNADDGSETSKTRFEINSALSSHFSPSNALGGSGKANAGFDRSKLESVLGSMKYLNDQAIEIIPSSEFFKQKGNMADIAAVIKPPELSDELVKAALPPQISSVPQLSYPTQQLIQNPQGFTSISQLQQYFATAQPSPLPTQTYPQPQLIHPHQQFQHQIPQQQLFFHQGGGFIPQQLMHQFHATQLPQPTASQLQQQHLQHLQQPQQPQQHQLQQQQQQSSQSVKAPGDSALGFSDFEIPAGVDPDIASLLRAELSKDDIPEEFRKDFIEAQEQEKAKLQQQKQQQQHQQQQASASRLRVTVIKPGQPKQQQQQHASKRIDRNENSKPEIKFHKPIPINPTMLTPTKGKPIRASPVPRYVVELARKLKTDKDVQGIVRVSTKRNRGPPIEYLYPVRG